MYFPWVGLLEQIRLADVFVHYDDVQYARGFFNRVQVKAQKGPAWLTVPLHDVHQHQKIYEVTLDRQDWRRKHLDLLRQCYRGANFFDEMLALVTDVFAIESLTLTDIARASMMALASYFGLLGNRRFVDSRDLNIQGASSQRLLDITRAVGGDVYITGHGGRNYLDHELFERAGVAVEYMCYRRTPYPQLNGAFNPYVSALDLVANCGRAGAGCIGSGSTPWRTFLETCRR
jgi:hypothetical protein